MGNSNCKVAERRLHYRIRALQEGLREVSHRRGRGRTTCDPDQGRKDLLERAVLASRNGRPSCSDLRNGPAWSLSDQSGHPSRQVPEPELWVHDLTLLWQILRRAGFPNQFFSDSWVVGFWRGRPWLAGHWIGERSLDAG